VIYRMTLFLAALSDPNYPKSPHFPHFVSPFISSYWVEIEIVVLGIRSCNWTIKFLEHTVWFTFHRRETVQWLPYELTKLKPT